MQPPLPQPGKPESIIGAAEDTIARVGWRAAVRCAASTGGEQLDVLVGQRENGAPVETASIWIDTYVTVGMSL
jgi:hypothetical protein